MLSTMTGRELESEYVREQYDSMLRAMPSTYAAHRWDSSPVARAHYLQTRRALLAALPEKAYGRVLEIGGGDGVWTELVLPRAGSLDFLDISEEMIGRARKRLAAFPHVRYVRADFLEADIEAGAYDLALSVRNLEYMQDKKGAIRAYWSALRSEGRLVIVTKNPGFKRLGSMSEKKLHSQQISVRDLVRLFADQGFTDIDVRPAIIGVGLKYALARIFWSLVQSLLILAPSFLVPHPLLALLCESFVVSAKKP